MPMKDSTGDISLDSPHFLYPGICFRGSCPCPIGTLTGISNQMTGQG